MKQRGGIGQEPDPLYRMFYPLLLVSLYLDTLGVHSLFFQPTHVWSQGLKKKKQI